MAGFGIDTSGQVVLQQPDLTSTQSGLTLSGQQGQAIDTMGSARLTSEANVAEIAGALNARRQHDTGAATMEAVNKLAGGVLDKYVAEMQQQAYFDGAAQIVQGRTLKDVQKDQPWITRIFGPSASVKGAQAMTVLQAMNESQAQFMKDMPVLRTQGVDDVRQYLVNQAKQVNVGDPAVDNLIRTKMMENWQPMLELHAKQNYAFVQEQNVNAFGQLQISQGNALQATLKNGGADLNEDTTRAMREQTINSFQPLPGMDRAAYLKSIQGAATANLMQGNFAWFRVFKSSDAFRALDADQQAKLLTHQERYEQQWKSKARTEELGVQLGTLVAQANAGTMSPNELIAATRQINQQYAVSTGSETPLIDGKELGELIKGNVGAILRADERLDAKREKLAEKQDAETIKNMNTAHSITAFESGQGSAAWEFPKGDRQLAEQVFSQMYNTKASKDPATANDFLIKNFNNAAYVNQSVENQFTAGVRATVGQGYTDAFQTSYAQYKALRDRPGGDAAAAAYFGKYAKEMETYHAQVTVGVDPASAWHTAFMTAPDIKAGINRAGGVKEFRKQVDNAIDSHFGGFFNERPGLSPAARNYAYDIVAGDTSIRTQGTGWDVGKAAEVSLKASRLDQLGDNVYLRRDGENPVAATLRIPDDAFHKTWVATRDAVMEKVGAKGQEVQNVQRLPGDEINLVLAYVDKEGLPKTVIVNGNQIVEQYKKSFPFGNNAPKGSTLTQRINAGAYATPRQDQKAAAQSLIDSGLGTGD